LDKYGLHGCGGDLGPPETLAFYARAHGVPLERLLNELREASTLPTASAPKVRPRLEDILYRRFFKAGIFFTLTAGATWGAYLLLRIAFARSFTALPINEVNAHGHAQIFGWVGMFVMGFAYQAFPRFRHMRLRLPAVANLSFFLMVAGVALATASEALLKRNAALAYLGLVGGGLEIVAALLFALVMLATLLPITKPMPAYEAYILASLFWFVAQTIASAAYFWATARAPTREALLGLISTYQAPLRDLQIHGFAMLMILGVSQRFLPGMYGLPQPSQRLAWTALPLLQAAILGEAAGFVAFRLTGRIEYAEVLGGSILVLAATVATLTSKFGLFRRCAESDRGLKFIRTAYLWLWVSFALLVAMPIYLRLSGQEFSHAYFGATRHAITVGFISMMIVGVASKVVPTLLGVDVRKLNPLWPTFALLNTGCMLRVVFQVLTDFWPGAFAIAGVSGVLEVSGLAIWGLGLWALMNRQTLAAVRRLAAEDLTQENTVAEVLEAIPQSEKVFVGYGFTAVQNPVLRRTLARSITLGQACRMKGLDAGEFLKAIREAANVLESAGTGVSAPGGSAQAATTH